MPTSVFFKDYQQQKSTDLKSMLRKFKFYWVCRARTYKLRIQSPLPYRFGEYPIKRTINIVLKRQVAVKNKLENQIIFYCLRRLLFTTTINMVN